ncbi:hypothetical protein B0H14DRAFT_3489258 [Mycena olivaceomarginata]|nr:hypothetical protein B0H14DRAFT_3489258 [Mycena olivaceomarginata]
MPMPPPHLAHHPTFAIPASLPTTAATEIVPPTCRFPQCPRTTPLPPHPKSPRSLRVHHAPRTLATPSHRLENLKYGQGAPVLWNTGTTGVGADKDRDRGKGKKEDKKIPNVRVYTTWEYESKDFRVGIKKPRGQPAVQQQQPQPGRRSSRAVG